MFTHVGGFQKLIFDQEYRCNLNIATEKQTRGPITLLSLVRSRMMRSFYMPPSLPPPPPQPKKKNSLNLARHRIVLEKAQQSSLKLSSVTVYNLALLGT